MGRKQDLQRLSELERELVKNKTEIEFIPFQLGFSAFLGLRSEMRGIPTSIVSQIPTFQLAWKIQ